MGLTEKPTDNIRDINLDVAERQRFRINGNPDAIIELNLSDMGIVDRMEKGVEMLNKKMGEIARTSSEDENLSEKLKQIDQDMRDVIDNIFDYPVSAVCAKYGTMYDPKDGKFRWESILDGLTKLYTNNLNEEYKRLNARLKKHTSKYTTGKKSGK